MNSKHFIHLFLLRENDYWTSLYNNLKTWYNYAFANTHKHYSSVINGKGYHVSAWCWNIALPRSTWQWVPNGLCLSEHWENVTYLELCCDNDWTETCNYGWPLLRFGPGSILSWNKWEVLHSSLDKEEQLFSRVFGDNFSGFGHSSVWWRCGRTLCWGVQCRLHGIWGWIRICLDGLGRLWTSWSQQSKLEFCRSWRRQQRWLRIIPQRVQLVRQHLVWNVSLPNGQRRRRWSSSWSDCLWWRQRWTSIHYCRWLTFLSRREFIGWLWPSVFMSFRELWFLYTTWGNCLRLDSGQSSWQWYRWWRSSQQLRLVACLLR